MQKTSEKTDQLIPALFAARKNFMKVLRDKKNTHLKNSYATLDSVLDTITPPLEDKDLMIEQSMGEDSSRDALSVWTTVRHISGQWISYYTLMPIAKVDPQGTGSAFTYARRYALAACFGLSQADDDAERAVMKAKDWNKRLDKAEDLEALTKIFGEAWKGSDAVNKPLVQQHYEKLKAGFSIGIVAENGGGFTKPDPKQRKSIKDAVESQQANPVQSETNPSDIESFE